ncbi:MAG: hypothetical protein QOI73_1391 [Solirubrobacteraceae bacterium]|nr:hypothetical protein [Solirubrobacteraceae bacterium]
MAGLLRRIFGLGGAGGSVWALDEEAERGWKDLSKRQPVATGACHQGLVSAPYPSDWRDPRHGPVKDAKQHVGPDPAWMWRVNDVDRVVYRRSPVGPVVIHAGPRW